MAYADFEDLTRKTTCDKILRDKAYNIALYNFANMQLISKSNKEIRSLKCVTDILSKYAWVIPLKDNNC